jgi:2-phospho-L-lactate transferase/gluconeogenesis factor (CofD/UPF0052 family)/hydroxymethylpyrimidine pyrophosphatase-like HAD family hydrolase
MNILILAGGTGSIALQTGIYQLTSKFEGLDVKVLVNAYDNGLSTGAVRKVLGGHILGPSDVRKNQTTRFKLEQPEHPLNAFMNIRFTTSAKEAKAFCLYEIEKYAVKNANFPEDACIDIFRKAVETYFSFPMATKIDYDDFSLSNIIYAGLAAQNGNSLRAAARIMARIMGIKDNVIINDDTSLFLGAVTRSGKKIMDEGDIVCWNNPEDPIVDLTFTDAYGEERPPRLCEEAKNALLQADVIILSSGTQWSSLIPTYESLGFRYAMSQTQAKVLMVMNRYPDNDAPNQSASDIINTLVPAYFPLKKINLILDNTGHPQMVSVDDETAKMLQSVHTFTLSEEYGRNARHTLHDSNKLSVAVLQTMFSEYLDKSSYVFDYDDTLIGRGNSQPNASHFNDRALNTLLQGAQVQTPLINCRGVNKKVAVCTGNSIRAIKLRRPKFPLFSANKRPLKVFADGGINEYEYTYPFDESQHDEPQPVNFIDSVWPDALFSEKSAEHIISSLCAAGITPAKIENRGNAVISIKPIDAEYRDLICDYINRIILANSDVAARITGRTTIDISLPSVSKKAAIELLLSELGPDDNLVFVGDEFESGNDKVIADYANSECRLKCLAVKSPTDTALFLIALLGGNFG